jgi:hypothetical protein
MSFLDNLESNLKSLEAQDEAMDQREQENRNAARAQNLAVAPWAEKLKQSAFTEELLRQATRIGFGMRIKVRITWIGTTLRLEAASRRLDLQPGPEGVVAVFFEGPAEVHRQPVDLDKEPAGTFARQWLERTESH